MSNHNSAALNVQFIIDIYESLNYVMGDRI